MKGLHVPIDQNPWGRSHSVKERRDIDAKNQRELDLKYVLEKTDLEVYRVSQEECEILRESVPYVKLYRYNPKHLHPKLNGYGDNDHRKMWASGESTYCSRP